MSDESPEQRPLLSVVKGDATPEEVAALVAVVAALGSGDEPPRRGVRRSGRPTTARSARTLPHGPGGWRSSALPR